VIPVGRRKRLEVRGDSCMCGCGNHTSRKSVFIPGHDARLRSYLIGAGMGEAINPVAKAVYDCWVVNQDRPLREIAAEIRGRSKGGGKQDER
jgi:hypothetical protein